MNHLEQLISEWYEFRGYFVRRNIMVCKRKKGGYKGELDIVAFNSEKNHLIHIEPSSDANSWAKREKNFRKKFDVGKRYITSEIFPGFKLPTIEQWAVLPASDTNHKTIGGGKVVPIKKLYQMITKYIKENGPPETNAIPEQFPLLRTIQFTVYYGIR